MLGRGGKSVPWTAKAIAALPVPEAGQAEYFHPTLRALGVRVSQGGTKTFFLRYARGGRARRITIGKFGPELTTPAAAVREASRIVNGLPAQLDEGERREDRREAVRLDDFFGYYEERHTRPRNRPSSVATDRIRYDKHVKPALGHKRLEDITPEEIERLVVKVAGVSSKTSANRIRSLLHAMFRRAIEWEALPPGTPNPAAGAPKFKEHHRERFLSNDEADRLVKALNQMEKSRHNLQSVAAVRIALLTGFRKGEILGIRWRDVDLDAGRVAIDGKTGKRVAVLSKAAVEVFKGLPQTSEWVFASPFTDGPLRDIRGTLKAACKLAKIEEIRMHDLRHSFASFAVKSGLSLYVTGALLGHRAAATTQRYAHLADDTLRQSVEAVSAAMAKKVKKSARGGNGRG